MSNTFNHKLDSLLSKIDNEEEDCYPYPLEKKDTFLDQVKNDLLLAKENLKQEITTHSYFRNYDNKLDKIYCNHDNNKDKFDQFSPSIDHY